MRNSILLGLSFFMIVTFAGSIFNASRDSQNQKVQSPAPESNKKLAVTVMSSRDSLALDIRRNQASIVALDDSIEGAKSLSIRNKFILRQDRLAKIVNIQLKQYDSMMQVEKILRRYKLQIET